MNSQNKAIFKISTVKFIQKVENIILIYCIVTNIMCTVYSRILRNEKRINKIPVSAGNGYFHNTLAIRL